VADNAAVENVPLPVFQTYALAPLAVSEMPLPAQIAKLWFETLTAVNVETFTLTEPKPIQPAEVVAITI
jgi:hypothetical protein